MILVVTAAARISVDALTIGLRARLLRPQRHRLLQGYPALPEMRFAVPGALPLENGVRLASGGLETQRAASAAGLEATRKRLSALRGLPSRTEREREERARHVSALEARIRALESLLDTADPAEPPFVQIDRSRDLIVGVIPHTQCTPRVDGCGFCTFPQDRPDKRARGETISAVGREISSILTSTKALLDRDVKALYFGGGTANLAKPEQIAELFACLAKHLRLGQAEVTLEGIPSLFASWFHAPLKMLASLPVRQRRISMGIQTFDAETTRAMGRSSFGDERAVSKLVAKCRTMDITTSGDLLFNLPGQSIEAMVDDVDRAIASGLDQICLYNLVLYEGLGTAWSKDPAQVAAMPDNESACEHWTTLRQRLLSARFTQTTLTNFERGGIAESDRAFLYERASFSPERTDAIGFGPMSLSTFVDPEARRAIKLLRRKNLTGRPWSGDDLFHPYDPAGLRLLFIVRSIAKGSFSKAAYAALCGSNLVDDFSGALVVLASEGLLEEDDDEVRLTPRGMFFSDAAVATFVEEQQPEVLGAGVRTLQALAAPTRLHDDYDGMG